MSRPTWNEAKHTVSVPLPKPSSWILSDAIGDWLKDNAEDSDFIHHIARDRHDTLTFMIGFVDPAKAMLFKLTWANTEII
ncbi:hypothetical protein D3C72_1123480 [compost metagenome]